MTLEGTAFGLLAGLLFAIGLYHIGIHRPNHGLAWVFAAALSALIATTFMAGAVLILTFILAEI